MAKKDQTDPAYASTSGTDVRVPVREEELVVGKQVEEEGRVHLHKDVVAEQQTVNVPTQHEQVQVEHVAYSNDAGTIDDNAFQEQDIDVPLMGEEAVAGKRVRGVEEVRIHKDVVTENQQVSDTVRKERVRVDDNEVDSNYTAADLRSRTVDTGNTTSNARTMDATTDGYNESGDLGDDASQDDQGLGSKIRRGVDKLVNG